MIAVLAPRGSVPGQPRPALARSRLTYGTGRRRVKGGHAAEQSGLTPLFPLFGADTAALAREMIASGLGARITCVDPRVLDRRFAGRDFDAALLADLPRSVDPCGERGEFHTFAYRGPMFAHAIPIESSMTVERDGFVFADLLPAAPVTP